MKISRTETNIVCHKSIHIRTAASVLFARSFSTSTDMSPTLGFPPLLPPFVFHKDTLQLAKSKLQLSHSNHGRKNGRRKKQTCCQHGRSTYKPYLYGHAWISHPLHMLIQCPAAMQGKNHHISDGRRGSAAGSTTPESTISSTWSCRSKPSTAAHCRTGTLNADRIMMNNAGSSHSSHLP